MCSEPIFIKGTGFIVEPQHDGGIAARPFIKGTCYLVEHDDRGGRGGVDDGGRGDGDGGEVGSNNNSVQSM